MNYKKYKIYTIAKIMGTMIIINNITACNGSSNETAYSDEFAYLQVETQAVTSTPATAFSEIVSPTPEKEVLVSDNKIVDMISDISKPSAGKIFLYGEEHGIGNIIDKEFELWYEYYHNQGMRHLFVEYGYYTAEFLNIWMQSDNDDILKEIYNDWAGTQAHVTYTKEFYKKIKAECPETIFHGTDVGHQYNTTGERYLKYLTDNGLKNSEQYLLAEEAIKQGKTYYMRTDSNIYRENRMVENFICEFDKLKDKDIMGLYGSAHTNIDGFYPESNPSMANQLKERYGENIFSEDLSWIKLDIKPLRTDIISINGKEYEASYFGKQIISEWSDIYASREFWRLENAYGDFKELQKTNSVLPYNNYPMLIETGQVFVIDYTKTDKSIERQYLRSDGMTWKGLLTTEEFTVK